MYIYGRADVTPSDATVIGINTLWDINVEGKKICFLGDENTLYDVDTFTSATEIEISPTPSVLIENGYYIIDDEATIKKNIYKAKIMSNFDRLFVFHLTDPENTVLRFTDRPCNASTGYEYPSGSGNYYLPKGILYNNLSESSEDETNSIEIVMECINHSIKDYVLRGDFRRAVVEIYEIYKWDDEDYNSLVFSAEINDFEIDGIECSLSCLSVSDSQKIKIRTCSTDCQYGFWRDTRCGITRPSTPEQEYSVDHLTTTAGVLRIDNSGIPVEESEYFDYSELVLKNDSGEIVAYLLCEDWNRDPDEDSSTDKAEMLLRIPLADYQMPEAGWTVEIRRSCNRTFTHCKRFSNTDRFGGFRFIVDQVRQLGAIYDD